MKPKIMMTRLGFITFIFSLLCLSGCDKLFEDKSAESETEAPLAEAPKINHATLLSAANLYVYTQLSEALNHAQTLDRVITSFLHHPNPLSLEESQQAWKKAYHAYLRASYFYTAPRFEKPQFVEQNTTYRDIHLKLDTWPIEGGYIDYLPGYPLSGIINDMTLKISEASLLEQHGFSDMSYASVGFHPLEFLLFGENGKRSARDFIPKENSMEVVSVDANEQQDASESKEPSTSHTSSQTSAQPLEADVIEDIITPQNHNRRREYLRILSALVVSDLEQLVDRWKPAHGYYAKAWRHPDTQHNLERLFQGAVDQLATTVLAKQLTPMLLEEDVDQLRSPYSQSDMDNLVALVEGVQRWWEFENSISNTLSTQQPDLASGINKQFSALLKRLKKAPKGIELASLAERKKALDLIQKDLVKLLEQMYGSAQVLGLRLQALPLSHE